RAVVIFDDLKDLVLEFLPVSANFGESRREDDKRFTVFVPCKFCDSLFYIRGGNTDDRHFDFGHFRYVLETWEPLNFDLFRVYRTNCALEAVLGQILDECT